MGLVKFEKSDTQFTFTPTIIYVRRNLKKCLLLSGIMYLVEYLNASYMHGFMMSSWLYVFQMLIWHELCYLHLKFYNHRAENETKAKLEKVAEIKKVNAAMMAIKSEISKYEDTLKEYHMYRKFLDNLTPQVCTFWHETLL